MSSWHDYGKVFAVGHKAVKDIFQYNVLVEEKIDGAQFSFGLIDDVLKIKSHHCDISNYELDTSGMFTEAIRYVRELYDKKLLHPGWTYRGEVVWKKKPNRLEYERVPRHQFIGFDIAIGEEDYLSYIDKQTEFARLDLETVPYMLFTRIDAPETIKTLLDRQPYLGGKFIEGVVIKAYGHFGEDKKTLMAKYVSERYKEEKPAEETRTSLDWLSELIEKYRVEARWEKAVQHFQQAGKLQSDPRDIGPLLGEIVRDLQEECGEKIREAMWKRFWPHIARGCHGGFPEWYKRKLLEGAFPKSDTPELGSFEVKPVDVGGQG